MGVVGDSEVAAAVWEHSNAGVLAVDAAGRITLVNAAACRILGGAAAEARLGAPCRDALAEHPPLVRLLCEALAGRPPLARAELTLEGPDGEPRILGFSVAGLPGPGDAAPGAVIVFRDLTPIERAGERERLRQRLAALGEMAAGLAHELRNPLAGMEIAAGLLERRVKGDAESGELVADLRGQLRRLDETVTASLDFLRPVSLRCEALDPAELLEECLSGALARAPRPARIERRYACPLPVIEADRQLLGVALVNLIVNACEAMAGAARADSRLELAIETAAAPGLPCEPAGDVAGPERRELRLAVGDNGPGVSEAVRDRIFDPFFSTKEVGSGIGLANVQKIVSGHDGALSFDSGPDGSVFRLHLPLDGASG